MHHDHCCYDCMTVEEYRAYAPVRLKLGLCDFTFYVEVTQPMAESFKRAHLSLGKAMFKLVELNGKTHTINLFAVDYIITL